MADREAVYRVTEAFSFDAEGRPWVMRAGDLVDESHPAFKRGKPYLVAVEAQDVRDQNRSRTATTVDAVETATAVPGAKRTVTRPMVTKV